MPKMSKTKGKVGELEAAKLIASYGFEARRGQQFTGGDGSPDVVHNIPGIHIEVKRTERLLMYDAMNQAIEDAGDKIPVVFHRKNRGDWLAVMPAADFLRIMKGAHGV